MYIDIGRIDFRNDVYGSTDMRVVLATEEEDWLIQVESSEFNVQSLKWKLTRSPNSNRIHHNAWVLQLAYGI